MMRCCLLGLVVLTGLSGQVAVAQPIVVEPDGSVKGQFHCGGATAQPVVFRFGLPARPAERRWEENGVLRGLWLKNGVRYLQSVLVADGKPETGSVDAADPSRRGQMARGPGESAGEGTPDVGSKVAAGRNARGPGVLLVNIEGENTNGEYAEAFAELALEIGGRRQRLELKSGLVWCNAGESRSLVGALEIPESGIKAASGEALKFRGNMPPSMKGSMTLKIPLERLAEGKAPDWLTDLEFEGVVRPMVRSEDASSARTNSVRVVFSAEERVDKGGR